MLEHLRRYIFYATYILFIRRPFSDDNGHEIPHRPAIVQYYQLQ